MVLMFPIVWAYVAASVFTICSSSMTIELKIGGSVGILIAAFLYILALFNSSEKTCFILNVIGSLIMLGLLIISIYVEAIAACVVFALTLLIFAYRTYITFKML